MKRGVALAHLSKHQEALAAYEKALEYSPRDVLVRIYRGIELAQAKDLDAGIAELQNVVDESVNEENANDDSLPLAFVQLGRLLLQKGDLQRGSDNFRNAIRLKPNYVEAHLELAYALAHEGHLSEALSEYRAVAKLSPSDFDRGYADILASQWLGNALRDMGNYSAAASAYRQAIRLKPDYSAAHCTLGIILLKQGHFRQAIEQYNTALVPSKSEELNDSNCLDLLGKSVPAAVGH